MRMVVTDLDGTLLNNDHRISARTSRAIKALEKKQVMFVIATARPQRHVRQIFPANFPIVSAIYYNGAEIYHEEKLIYHNCIEENTVKWIVEWLQKRYPGLHIALEISNHLYTNFDIKVMKHWLPPYEMVDYREFNYRPTAKILVDLQAISDPAAISAILPGECRMVVTDGGTLGQIGRRNVSKVNAIKSLATIFRFDLEDVVAFGDDYNDVEMIKECGIGVAMGNAPQEVKDIADLVAATNDEDGVAVELERIFGI